MKVKMITVGKLKEKYLKEGIAEYSKRLSRFTKLELIEVADEKISDNASQVEKDAIMTREAERVLSKISDREYVIVLAIEGEELPSETFSQILANATLNGYSTLTFIIGGSLGLSSIIKKKAHQLVSFGKMTLPHQLMRLVLIEQIYRAFMIQQGSPYHK
ncbi:23S rRNA (pseudouridine(1915)-N(3))-methyltransferase RlmH [Streptococcus sciuri]|uniref:Ribosomal RNA large subunit methyltransferase H n=1 Tax=Streptococcus sciuri TaxID=2973939 RepID=A0ABT2F677_9STRE|nr:23S rRNA (pseudouridine(1915)-N(3))-methyltransferase RlmH [Streptococcus sciuri]MCS4487971.1 23S rRNA (pseudouridine(1915)-N(3))-methyltransferase RlmH [Streptococcus sciuri]